MNTLQPLPDSVNCQACGQGIRVPHDYTRRRIKCPGCGAMCQVAQEPLEPLNKEPTYDNDEDTSNPCILQDQAPICRRCQQVMPLGATACIACGYNPSARPTSFEPVERHWEQGMSSELRIRLFLIGEGVSLTSVVAGAFLGVFESAVISWVILTFLMLLMLGTFDRVDLTRNQRGRVVLKRTWRVCCVPLQPYTFKLSNFDGIASGQDREADGWDWVALYVLAGCGLLPAILWWYIAFHRIRFFVALSNDHGAPACFLYRGLNQKYMQEMAATLAEVAFPIILSPKEIPR